jgi:hypothetical protein
MTRRASFSRGQIQVVQVPAIASRLRLGGAAQVLSLTKRIAIFVAGIPAGVEMYALGMMECR